MLLIDFTKLDPQYLGINMVDLGMADFKNLPFPTIIQKLGLESDKDAEEYFPTPPALENVNIATALQKLREQKKIVDVIGPSKIPRDMPIGFSTLLGKTPKAYLKTYIEVAKILCKTSPYSGFVVWLEDTLSAQKNGWDANASQQSIEAYQRFFATEFPESRILVSSQIAPLGIPADFLEKFSELSTAEFLSVLPFHLRNPMFIKTLDVVHFVWNCYVLYRLSCVSLAGINNKRHFQLFRKVLDSKMTTILVPLGSESTLT